MAWWSRSKEKKSAVKALAEKRSVPSGLFRKCDDCGATLETERVKEALYCCPRCGHHFPMPTAARIELLVDQGSWREEDAEVRPVDRLGFVDGKRYADRILLAQRNTGALDAFRSGSATVLGRKVALGVFAFEFMGGSMGSVVGEKVARSIETAIAERRACVIVSATGGARMQEGILSLMQMAKTSVLLARLREARLPFVSVLTDPSTAGVLASYASLGDVIVAEPKALVGFAGARVIKQTIGEDLPPGFQRAEFVLEKGFIDRIIHRKQMRDELGQLLEFFWHSTRGFAPEGGKSPHQYDPNAPRSA